MGCSRNIEGVFFHTAAKWALCRQSLPRDY